ncbi:MAG: co-chaperone YbbN [Rhodospirillales bacterium]|nr:co-chaperone YbbN [Rhodospirillales bacterium]
MASILGENDVEMAAGEGEAGGGGELIANCDNQNFVPQVIEASAQTPVIVDFWAPRCELCKTLSPTLEKLVREYSGAVRLVKINVDENKELSQQLRVQSIPMVFAFKGGRPVDAFQGVQAESEVRRFIERLTGNEGSPVDQAMEEARQMLEDGNAGGAAEIYSQVLGVEPENGPANAGMARCLMAADDHENTQNYLNDLSDELRKLPEIMAVQTALDLAAAGSSQGAPDELAAAVEQNPDDHQTRFDLALALYGGNQAAQAIDQLIEIVRRDRKWNEEAARLQILKIFEALGNSDEITIEGRRRLSAVLFS